MRVGSQVRDPAPPRHGDGGHGDGGHGDGGHGDGGHGDGGGGGGWRWLVTAQGLVEAELIKGVLENCGVLPVALDAHDPSHGAWMFPSGNVNALVRVFVPAALLGEARLALLETGFSAVEQIPDAPDLPSRRSGLIRTLWVVLTCVLIWAVVMNALRAGTG